MGMGHAAWLRYSAARQEWEHKGWLLCHSYRTPAGRRYNFAVKRIISRSILGEPIPFNNLDDLLVYISTQPAQDVQLQLPLPSVVIIPSTVPQRVRRRSR